MNVSKCIKLSATRIFLKFPDMKIHFTITIILLHLLGLTPVLAQYPSLDFERYSIADGLSNDIVTTITKDRYGYIWVGTEDGLNRFDGYSFKVYKHNPFDSLSIITNEIQSLCCDSAGNLWIGTAKGLERYNRTGDNFIHYNTPHDNLCTGEASVISLIADRSNLWIGFSSGGLLRFDPALGTIERFRHSVKDTGTIPSDSITCLLIDRNGSLWIGFSYPLLSVYRPTEYRFKNYIPDSSDPGSLAKALITSICQDRAGTIWISTFGDGLMQFDKVHNRFIHYRNNPQDSRSITENFITSIAADAKGGMWISTYSAGVDCYNSDTREFRHYPPNPSKHRSVSSPRVYTIYPDETGSVWVGTWRGGLNVFHPWQRKFAHLEHRLFDSNSLNGDTVWAICEDSKGRLWIGTESGGLDCYDAGRNVFTHHVHSDRDKNSLCANYVIQVCEDHAGQIWVGTYGSGLDLFDEQHNVFVHHRHKPSDERTILSDSISSLCVDSNNQIWIGFDNGIIDRFDPTTDTFSHYVITDTIRKQTSGHETESIIEDKSGYLWIGTFGSGLFRLDRATMTFQSYFTTPADPHFLPYPAIYTLVPDSAGGIWIGTFAGGLIHYNPSAGTFQQFNELQGLASNYIKGIVPDSHGRIWLSSIKGLTLFDPAHMTFRNYDMSDGLQGIEFRRGACHGGAHGTIYFGGINGLNLFNPDSIHDNPNPPPVFLTTFKVFDQPLQTAKAAEDLQEVQLSYAQNFFTIEFVALNYSAPQKNRYAYRLEGFDKNWIECGTRRFASYTHLDGGQYLFRVKASNNDGIWNETGTTLRIIIYPPFWETWWFRGILVLLIAGIPVSIYRYRSRKLLVIERTRSRIARDLHDELSATVSGINFFAQAISKDPENKITGRSHNLLTLIHESTSSLQESISDIIWSVNPGHDHWNDILAKCRRFASDLFDARGIHCEYNFPDQLPDKPLPMEIRRNFWLCYKEMITNIIKHAQCRSVRITVQFGADKRAELEIRDDGEGFDPEAPTSGNGVINIHSRARLLRGKLSLQSGPGKGTEWRLKFPF